MRNPLTQEQIQAALKDLADWKFEDDRLKKSFAFEDFGTAMAFIVRLAFYAEQMNHHPEIRNVYNQVDIYLSTHDAGDRVTEMDVRLARAIEGISIT